jgi:hypothetical protein
MSMTDEQYDDVYADVRARLAEHFPNFMFIVMDDDGDIFYDYTNLPVGKMLVREMMEEVDSEDLDIDWDDEYEEVEESDEYED